MKTLKKGLKQEDIDSEDIEKIIKNYSHKDKVRIALWMTEDCFKDDKFGGLVRKWIRNKKLVKKQELKFALSHTLQSFVIRTITYNSTHSCRRILEYTSNNEYLKYARYYAYEDVDFPYRKEAKTFDLDNPIDLNIFLDFLTDNYHEALIYSREQFMNDRLTREYLKIIYQ